MPGSSHRLDAPSRPPRFHAIRDLVVIVSLALVAGPCAAQTQADANTIAIAALQAANNDLNTAYTSLRTRLNDQQKAALSATETAWAVFRDRHCVFESQRAFHDPSQMVVRAACLTALTRDRLAQINAQLTCKSSDLACVAPAN